MALLEEDEEHNTEQGGKHSSVTGEVTGAASPTRQRLESIAGRALE